MNCNETHFLENSVLLSVRDSKWHKIQIDANLKWEDFTIKDITQLV